MNRFHGVSLVIVVFLGSVASMCAAATPEEDLKGLIKQANSALERKDFPSAAHACAGALKLSPNDQDSQACATALKPQLASVVQAGNAMLGAGEFELARDWCTAALMIDSGNTAAATCAKSATEQAQNDQKQEGALEYAKTLIADGKRDAAAQALKDVIASNASKSVRNRAKDLMKQSATSWPTVFRESLRAPWIMQFLAALLLVAGSWILLHWSRDVWRWAHTKFFRKKSAPWKFAGVADDGNLGAQDPVLDAIRRVPSEVKQAIWTPTRLLLYPGASGWEVWEDFGVTTKCTQLHETVFDPALTTGDGDKVLADAFQSLQYSVGPIGIGNIAKFWTGLVDWWHTGEPSFTGWAHQNALSDGNTETVIRLTCSGGAYGTVSALASTLGESGVDAVSLSAERAAYKLLHRMAPKHDETAEQIDAHAAFRQGATTIARCVRSVVDVQTDKDAHDARLNKAAYNAEFARQIFNRDPDKRLKYYAEALRLQAIAYAMLGRDGAALMCLEELEDTTTPPKAAREEQIRLESLYNQAILHLKRGMAPNAPPSPDMHTAPSTLPSPDTRMAGQLLVGLAKGADAELARAARVWRLAQLSFTSRAEWGSLDQADSEAVLKGASALIQALETAATAGSGHGRRQYMLLANQARRHYAVAQLRFIAAFTHPGRVPLATGAALGDPIAALVQSATECFARSDVIGPETQSALVMRAYALLLQSKWEDAEQLAKQALALDPTDQFAVYVAAEASYQRKDDIGARKYLGNLQVALFTDRALSELASVLNPPPGP